MIWVVLIWLVLFTLYVGRLDDKIRQECEHCSSGGYSNHPIESYKDATEWVGQTESDYYGENTSYNGGEES